MILIDGVQLKDLLNTITSERNKNEKKVDNVSNELFDIIKRVDGKNSLSNKNRYLQSHNIKEITEN